MPGLRHAGADSPARSAAGDLRLTDGNSARFAAGRRTTQLPDLDELLKSSWRILRRQMGLCIAATRWQARLFGFIFALSLPLFAAQAVGNRQAEPLITIYMIAWWLAANLLMSVFQAGQIAFFLKIVRGQPATIGDFFSGWRGSPPRFSSICSSTWPSSWACFC